MPDIRDVHPPTAATTTADPTSDQLESLATTKNEAALGAASAVLEPDVVTEVSPDDLPVLTATYVLDTCVLLADPNCLYRFAEHDVVIPLVVVEELDKQKTRMDEVGANARHAVRVLEELRATNGGTLTDAADLPTGGRVWVETNFVDVELPPYLDAQKPDHRILATALGLHGVLVTKDVALRLKGASLGVAVQDYRGDTERVHAPYDGVTDLQVAVEDLDTFHREGQVTLEDEEPLLVNESAVLHAGPSAGGLGRVVESEPLRIRKVSHRSTFGIHPRDARQTLALDLLMDPEVPCVSMMGMAGTGKTFMALAGGLEQLLELNRYRRVSVYRPLVAVGRQEVGYLPGDLDEKLAPWMSAVYDNLYALFRRDSGGHWNGHRSATQAVQGLLDRGQLEMAAITYLRGRSITDEYVIIDEAQNLELSTLKVILTRIGEGSKIVFCGDLGQIDNPYISPYGGMAALIERMKGNPLFGHIELEKGQRSPLAEIAATAL